VANESRTLLTNSLPSQDDESFVCNSLGAVDQAGINLVSEQNSPAFSGHKTVEQSSARVSPRNDEDVEVLKHIVNTLRLRKVPGPQLFRARTEFKKKLGKGAEGSVRTTDQSVDEEIKNLELGKVEGSQIERPQWNKFAIKRHGPPESKSPITLKNYLAAAEAEINTLSDLLRGHPNIVQLRGWGLCLDTIESTQNISRPPLDLSPFNLHLPLLILERADGNFKEFLDHVFGSDDGTRIAERSRESRAEEGLSQLRDRPVTKSPSSPLVLGPVPLRQERVSLSGSTLQEEDGDESMTPQKYATVDSDAGEESGDSPHFSIISGMSRYEVLRRLCIDIGHGLQGLHVMKMTHGDLKPRNVLVFGEGPRWTAKLCDFGHSNKFDPSNDSLPYLGTPEWRPHWFGDTIIKHNIATLRAFDLTVYGLLVWSAFRPSRRGEAPNVWAEFPKSDPCVLFDEDLTDMVPPSCMGSVLGSKAAVGRRVSRLVKGTVCANYMQSKAVDETVSDPDTEHHVDERPWEHLYGKMQHATSSLWNIHVPADTVDSTSIANSERNATEVGTKTIPRGTSQAQIRHRLKASVKSRYRTVLFEWWRKRHDRELPQTLSLLTSATFLPVDRPFIPFQDETEKLYRSVGSSLYGSRLLHDSLCRLLKDKSKDPTKVTLLYSLARLRSTAPVPAIWNNIPSRENIVQLALTTMPPLDICALAWLCKGEVGAEDVRNLPAQHSTWEVILGNRSDLNESERLERFLLLMQFGARIEQILGNPLPTEGRRSILSTYLNSCRLATRAFVAKEICQHYEMILPATKPNKPDTTRYYMTAARGSRPKGMTDDCVDIANWTALGSIESDKQEHKATYPFLKLNFEQLLDKQNDTHLALPLPNVRRCKPGPDETTHLLATDNRKLQTHSDLDIAESTTCRRNFGTLETPIQDRHAIVNTKPVDTGLPPPPVKPSLPGWREFGNAFLNELTNSITLKKPTVQLTHLRRIIIGHIGSANVLEIDMADFALPPDSSPSSWEREQACHALRQRIKDRFPLMDDTWFSTECDRDDRDDDDDVLASIKDDVKWDQETQQALYLAFQVKPPDFSAEAFLAKNLNTLLFFIQYPTTTLGLLWELVLSAHDRAGAPITVSYAALHREIRSLDATRKPLLRVLQWAPAVFGRVVVLFLAGVACLLGAAFVVAVTLAVALAFVGL
jgi:serine/threonine protein kinase